MGSSERGGAVRRFFRWLGDGLLDGLRDLLFFGTIAAIVVVPGVIGLALADVTGLVSPGTGLVVGLVVGAVICVAVVVTVLVRGLPGVLRRLRSLPDEARQLRDRSV